MRVGTTISGRYRLVSEIGTGASCRVYFASDLQLQRPVTVKFFTPSTGGVNDREVIEEAIAEAAGFNHRGVVAILDSGFEAGLFVVVEHCSGGSLADEIEYNEQLSGPRVAEIASGILETLDAAHRCGLIHLGLKPTNVLFDDEGRIKVSDFGFNRISDSSAVFDHNPSTVMGNGYLAPEQVRGGDLTPAADLYAVGLVMAEALAGGRVVRQGGGLIVITESAYRPSRAFLGDDELGRIVERATATEVSDRYASAAEMLAALNDMRATGRDAIRSVDRLAEGRDGSLAVPVGTRMAAAVAIGEQVSAHPEALPPAMGEPTTSVALLDPHSDHPRTIDEMATGIEFDDAFAWLDQGRRHGHGGPERTDIVGLPDEFDVDDFGPDHFAPDGEATVVELPGRHRRTEASGEPSDSPEQEAPPVVAISRRRARRADKARREDRARRADKAPREVKPPRAVKTRSRGRRLLMRTAVIAVAIAVAVALAVGGAVALVSNAPDVLGLNIDAARSAASEAGANVEISPESPNTFWPAGTVIAQTPPPSSMLWPGDHLRLTISGGPPPVAVPDTTGERLSVSVSALATAGLVAVVASYAFDPGPTGQVLAQDPVEGKAPQGSSVMLTVSAGPDPRAVPDVVGRTRADAEAAMREDEFEPAIRPEFSDTVKQGLVISVSPDSGTKARPGYPTTLVVSKGPQTVPLPDVRGSRVTDATSKLQSLGLVVKLIQIVGQEKVVAMDPGPGTQVRKGATVTLTTGT